MALIKYEPTNIDIYEGSLGSSIIGIEFKDGNDEIEILIDKQRLISLLKVRGYIK